MSQRTVAGSKYSVASGLPATHDQAGFEAMSFTEVGEIINMGEIGGEYNPVTINNISERIERTIKGSYRPGLFTLQLGEDSSDAGQIILKGAAYTTPDADFSHKITDQNGEVTYFSGLIMKFTETRGTNDDIVGVNTDIAINTTLVEVAAP